jgi:hypothetical protein
VHPAHRKVDFDDLVLLALQLLERTPAVTGVVAGGVHHLLVDEFQVRLLRHCCPHWVQRLARLWPWVLPADYRLHAWRSPMWPSSGRPPCLVR